MKLHAFLTALCITGASMVSAQSVTVPSTLSGLVSSGSTGVTIGDKTFYDFIVSGSIDMLIRTIPVLPTPANMPRIHISGFDMPGSASPQLR